ncbi:Butyrophilin-like protein 2 [Chelonia mydas]|uniref:Butyrophilin-like protein 2 n=1 Tax=Chelonia mydas TaxID=8469 RepID=M7BSU1_CHEMY|nr:Butyrophilin-like protein 2 [Chelonia mydas]
MSQGKLLASASEEITPEADGLFQTEIVIVLTEESNQKMSCCVRNPRLNQERESVISIAEILRSDMESEKETLLSEREGEKETLQSEMKRQKGQCLGPMGCVEDFMSSQSSQLSPANLTQLKATFNASGVTV